MQDVLADNLSEEFTIIDDRRYPMEIDSAEMREIIKLPYYPWEHTGTIGWYGREFSVLLNYKDRNVAIQETTKGNFTTISDATLLQKLLVFASGEGLLEYKQPEIALGAFHF